MVRIYINGVVSLISVGPCQKTALMNALSLMDPFQSFQPQGRRSRRKRHKV